MAQKIEYHESKLGAFLQIISTLVKRNMGLLDNPSYFRATLEANIPELKDKETCPNCAASMKEYIYTFDAWDALLLLAMAKAVRSQMEKINDFTRSNQVLVPMLPVSHATKCRTTQSAKLGLIAQLLTKKGKRVPGCWVITKRGWHALRGDPVPKRVKVWRKRIEERFEETITIEQALKSHSDYVEARMRKGFKPKDDQREAVRSFDPADWFEFGVHAGNIF